MSLEIINMIIKVKLKAEYSFELPEDVLEIAEMYGVDWTYEKIKDTELENCAETFVGLIEDNLIKFSVAVSDNSKN